jgi:hypothetical protein
VDDAKMKEGIFTGLQIRELIQDKNSSMKTGHKITAKVISLKILEES